jgi:hypothetical protein
VAASRAPIALALAALLLATPTAPGRGAPADEPPVLRVEELVRLHVAGVDEDELIDTIRTRPVDFDLSPEMVEELERAGLSARVIRAMQRRQAVMAPAEPAASSAGADTWHDSGPALRVVLDTKKKKKTDAAEAGPRYLRVYDTIDMGLADHWKLGNAPETMRFSGVAVFLACRTADHVPDEWRTRTPLLWSAPETPRHRMLAWHADARWTRATLKGRFGMRSKPKGEEGKTEAPAGEGKPGIVELELPPALEVPLAAGVAHDLSLGIALEVAGSSYPWIVASLDGVVLDEDGLQIDARIKGLRQPGLSSLDIDFGETARGAWTASKICARGCPGPSHTP